MPAPSELAYSCVQLFRQIGLDWLAVQTYRLVFVPLEWLEDGGWDAIPHMLGFHTKWCGPNGGHCIMTGKHKP